MSVTREEMLAQLQSLRDNSADMAKSEDADEIWARDVEALDMAIAVLKSGELYPDCPQQPTENVHHE